jgi:hypothetical protein
LYHQDKKEKTVFVGHTFIVRSAFLLPKRSSKIELLESQFLFCLIAIAVSFLGITSDTISIMTEYYQDTFRNDGDVCEVVSDAIAQVLNTFEEKLHENYLATLQKGFTAKLVLEKMNKMVSLAMLLPDGVFTPASEELEVFIPDGEPCPSTIDTWARGAVTTKKIAVADNTFRRAMPGFSNTPSIASSHKSGRSKGTSVVSRSRLGTSRGKYDDPLDATGRIIELDDEFGDFAHLNSTGQMFDQLQKMKRNKAQGYVSKETSEKGEFEIIQEQLDRAKKEMKGRNFVLDRYGKPIALGRVKIETLPSLSDSPILQVKDKQIETRASYDHSASAPLPTDAQMDLAFALRKRITNRNIC